MYITILNSLRELNKKKQLLVTYLIQVNIYMYENSQTVAFLILLNILRLNIKKEW